jgi:hypothetical protein
MQIELAEKLHSTQKNIAGLSASSDELLCTSKDLVAILESVRLLPDTSEDLEQVSSRVGELLSQAHRISSFFFCIFVQIYRSDGPNCYY